MQEREVTIGQTTYPLPDPFFVIATQNPIEQEGTYPLPEAQLDRFMFNIKVGYPSSSEEEQILMATTRAERPEVRKVLSGRAIVNIQKLVGSVAVSEYVVKYVARLVRATALSLLARDFVRAARALGAGHVRIMAVHLLPNALSPIIVATTLAVGNVILYESVLSFLGLGIQPPIASWGNMLTNAQELIGTAPLLAVWPGLLILVTVASCNLLGDALQDALDHLEAAFFSDSRRPIDGEIQTACSQSCPTNAIIFGDLNDENSMVSKWYNSGRKFEMLEEIGVRPSVFYLTKVWNREEESAHV